MAEEADQNAQIPEELPVRKRQKAPLEVMESKLTPRPSVWPIVLALTLVVAFIGVMTSPIILAGGTFLTVAAIIGWMLEKH
ncbi:MAG TPA: hypothetical protein VGD98_24410 [Ktedonobacteraceae bacterium]